MPSFFKVKNSAAMVENAHTQMIAVDNVWTPMNCIRVEMPSGRAPKMPVAMPPQTPHIP